MACITRRLANKDQFQIGIVLCATLLAASYPLQAQNELRRLTGTVTDPQHEPLAGAVVQLHDDNTDTVISYITNRTGRYTFQRIAREDDYHLWANFRGHKSRPHSLSKFDAKADRTILLVVRLE
jgi:hypothetical protein